MHCKPREVRNTDAETEAMPSASADFLSLNLTLLTRLCTEDVGRVNCKNHNIGRREQSGSLVIGRVQFGYDEREKQETSSSK